MAGNSVEIREEREEDGAFLLRLFALGYGASMAMLPLAENQKQAMVEMQWRAQDAHYRREFAGARFGIVLWEGTPVGRLCVWRGEGQMRVVDAVLLPEWRGRGIGAAVLEGVLDEARQARCVVRLRVEGWNRARRLYERLGFVEEGEQAGYVEMVWRPA
ncbi:MAG: GNAT family N-acetyltransferase [Bryobacterales bacterium]|nr:GNAT family N-acetyltransferase [Bryobacterales bacterium]